MPELYMRLSLLTCDDAISSRNSSNRFAILHDLLPPERDPSVSLWLQHSTVHPITQVWTKRYCSFINYSLKCYQWQPYMFVIATFYFSLCLYVVYVGFSCNFQEIQYYIYCIFILYILVTNLALLLQDLSKLTNPKPNPNSVVQVSPCS